MSLMFSITCNLITNFIFLTCDFFYIYVAPLTRIVHVSVLCLYFEEFLVHILNFVFSVICSSMISIILNIFSLNRPTGPIQS